MEFSCWVLQQYKYVFEKEKKWPALVMICKESELSRGKKLQQQQTIMVTAQTSDSNDTTEFSLQSIGRTSFFAGCKMILEVNKNMK